ncbi:DUF494 family protein, partial [bacterium]|nr:DUF494 family protein [bacterium]
MTVQDRQKSISFDRILCYIERGISIRRGKIARNKLGEAPMYQRIMEILILLMDELGGSSSSLDEMDQLSDDLIERGYTEQEINTAFYWLYNRFQKESTPLYHKFDITPPEESAHRVLHTLE